jgi:hypothetical protein
LTTIVVITGATFCELAAGGFVSSGDVAGFWPSAQMGAVRQTSSINTIVMQSAIEANADTVFPRLAIVDRFLGSAMGNSS